MNNVIAILSGLKSYRRLGWWLPKWTSRRKEISFWNVKMIWNGTKKLNRVCWFRCVGTFSVPETISILFMHRLFWPNYNLKYNDFPNNSTQIKIRSTMMNIKLFHLKLDQKRLKKFRKIALENSFVKSVKSLNCWEISYTWNLLTHLKLLILWT